MVWNNETTREILRVWLQHREISVYVEHDVDIPILVDSTNNGEPSTSEENENIDSGVLTIDGVSLDKNNVGDGLNSANLVEEFMVAVNEVGFSYSSLADEAHLEDEIQYNDADDNHGDVGAVETIANDEDSVDEGDHRAKEQVADQHEDADQHDDANQEGEDVYLVNVRYLSDGDADEELQEGREKLRKYLGKKKKTNHPSKNIQYMLKGLVMKKMTL